MKMIHGIARQQIALLLLFVYTFVWTIPAQANVGPSPEARLQKIADKTYSSLAKIEGLDREYDFVRKEYLNSQTDLFQNSNLDPRLIQKVRSFLQAADLAVKTDDVQPLLEQALKEKTLPLTEQIGMLLSQDPKFSSFLQSNEKILGLVSMNEVQKTFGPLAPMVLTTLATPAVDPGEALKKVVIAGVPIVCAGIYCWYEKYVQPGLVRVLSHSPSSDLVGPIDGIAGASSEIKEAFRAIPGLDAYFNGTLSLTSGQRQTVDLLSAAIIQLAMSPPWVGGGMPRIDHSGSSVPPALPPSQDPDKIIERARATLKKSKVLAIIATGFAVSCLTILAYSWIAKSAEKAPESKREFDNPRR